MISSLEEQSYKTEKQYENTRGKNLENSKVDQTRIDTASKYNHSCEKQSQASTNGQGTMITNIQPYLLLPIIFLFTQTIYFPAEML